MPTDYEKLYRELLREIALALHEQCKASKKVKKIAGLVNERQ